jgi:ribose 5-phosphate isomerase A
VATAAKTFVCITDASKRVERLGQFPLAIEVIPMAVSLVASRLQRMGGTPRRRPDFTTDNGNVILDVTGLDFSHPVQLELELDAMTGVVCSGLFARRRPRRTVAGSNGVQQIG